MHYIFNRLVHVVNNSYRFCIRNEILNAVWFLQEFFNLSLSQSLETFFFVKNNLFQRVSHHFLICFIHLIHTILWLMLHKLFKLNILLRLMNILLLNRKNLLILRLSRWNRWASLCIRIEYIMGFNLILTV